METQPVKNTRGRKPKNDNKTEISVDNQQKKRGRKNKKQLNILDYLNTQQNQQQIQQQTPQISQQQISEKSEENDENMIFEFRTLQSNTFKILIDTLKEILVEGNFECTKNGIRLISKCEKRGLLIDLNLKAENFEYYKCAEKIYIGLALDNLYKLIKPINNNSTLVFGIEENETQALIVKLSNNEKKITKTYTLKLIDLDWINHKIDNTEYDSILYITVPIFQKVCKDMSSIGDQVSIKIYKNRMILNMIPSDDKNTENIINEETIIDESEQYMKFIKTSNNIIQGTYNLKDLIVFNKCGNMANGTLKIYVKKEKPLILEYNIGILGTIRMSIEQLDKK